MSDRNSVSREDQYRRYRHEGGWVAAVALIAIGGIFLLRNLGVTIPGNWWALLLIIPIIGSLASAWQAYRRDGEASRAVIGSLIGAGLLTALMIAFLLDIDINWNLLWPVAIILIGVVMLLRGYRRW
jgi:peptidoglycan/LPS O-acetylase OafA/YrhL